PLPNPGRPWNPPYQPGPHLDELPVSHWAAGQGLTWVLNGDHDGLPYLLKKEADSNQNLLPPNSDSDLREFATQVTPEIFRPDGNLNPRQIPISLQLPDWSQWLPRIHPKDAWGAAFARSELATMYDGGTIAEAKSGPKPKSSLRNLLAKTQSP